MKQNSLTRFVEASWFTKTIMTLIVINALILGMETYPALTVKYGAILKVVDYAILWVFVAEIALKLAAYRLSFLRDPWNIFDTFVVAIAFVPSQEAFSVLRALRVLRVLRLISIFPRLRRVLSGLVVAIPGIGSIGAILAIIFYVFAVMSTKLFGAGYPELFGTLEASMFSLFQIMTLEGWGDMVREIAETHSFAKPYFIIYILIATFTVLNLFIAVIVDAMQREDQAEEKQEQDAIKRIEAELMRLHQKIDMLRK